MERKQNSNKISLLTYIVFVLITLVLVGIIVGVITKNLGFVLVSEVIVIFTSILLGIICKE